MNRRTLLGSLAASGHLSGAPALGFGAAALQEQLAALSLYGRPADGTFASGVTRIGYSNADIAARAFITGLMENAGVLYSKS